MKVIIDLPLAVSTTLSFSASMPAEIVDVAPHITVATFALHRTLPGSLDRFQVTNIETGQRPACYGAQTKACALSVARKAISRKTDADFLRAYKNAPAWIQGASK